MKWVLGSNLMIKLFLGIHLAVEQSTTGLENELLIFGVEDLLGHFLQLDSAFLGERENPCSPFNIHLPL